MKKPLFEVKDVDRVFYEKYLAGWLPDKIIDIHTHVWLKQFKERKTPGMKVRTVTWPSMVADQNPVEHLIETYELMFPGKSVTPLMFANLAGPKHFDAANDYVILSSRKHGFPALIFSDPCWGAREFEEIIEAGGLFGAKSYLTMAPSYLPAAEIRVRNEKLFAAVVGAAFGQRRKTLRNTLRSYLNEMDFEKLGIDAQLRAENLSVVEFTKVANYLDEPQPNK